MFRPGDRVVRIPHEKWPEHGLPVGSEWTVEIVSYSLNDDGFHYLTFVEEGPSKAGWDERAFALMGPTDEEVEQIKIEALKEMSTWGING